MKSKIATEAAEAFAAAVSSEEENPVLTEDSADSLQRKSVSWSDSRSVETADDLSRLGIDSGLPEGKMAALQKEASTRQGPYAVLIKEALSVTPGGILRTAGRGAITAGRGTARAGKAIGSGVTKGSIAATRGVNNAGRGIRNWRRSRGADLSISPGRAAVRSSPEAAFHTWHYGNMA